VAGWHYSKEFYDHICKIPQAQVFVISHRPLRQVPSWLFDYVDPRRVFFEINVGYDWGCYQQFLTKGIWQQFDYVVFTHDDVLVKDVGFMDKCIELCEQGHSVVGNGRVAPRSNYPNTHAQCYAHSSWKPPSRQFEHDVVRGSFFVATQEAVNRLGRFEVFWDPLRLTSGFGNWSARATCGKWEYLCGEKCFGFLSDRYCESDYLVELVRGGAGEDARAVRSVVKRWLVAQITRMSKLYMSVYWGERFASSRLLALHLMTSPLKLVSG